MGLKQSLAHLYLRTAERFRPPRSMRIVGTLLRALDIECAIDVGANRGQYAARLRRVGFEGRIISFEPVSDAYEALAATSGADPRWTAVRLAVGAEPGKQTIHVAGNSVSSSFLDMGQPHLDLAPSSAYTREEEVGVTTVAELLQEHAVDPTRALLKADVQGYERAVLDGAGDRLGELAVLQLETSLLELYDGQPLLPELLGRLTDAGFVLWQLFPGWVDRPSGRLWWGDGLFVRADLAERVPSRVSPAGTSRAR